MFWCLAYPSEFPQFSQPFSCVPDGNFHITHRDNKMSFTGIFLIIMIRCSFSFEPGHEKTCLMSYANNKGADQPALPRSMTSAFVIRCLDSIISLNSIAEISRLYLASVAEQVSLSLTWSETPEDMFSHVVAHFYLKLIKALLDELGLTYIWLQQSEITIPFKPRHEKTCLREFPTRSNWPAQLQKLAWGLKFWLQKLETLHYLDSEQQRRWSDCADAQADLRLCCSHLT